MLKCTAIDSQPLFLYLKGSSVMSHTLKITHTANSMMHSTSSTLYRQIWVTGRSKQAVIWCHLQTQHNVMNVNDF